MLFTGEVVAYGKLVAKQKGKAYPKMPKLDFLVFDRPEEHFAIRCRAICIQLEMDSCAETPGEAIDNLITSVNFYFEILAKENNSLREFIQKALNTIFWQSEIKDELFALYRAAEQKDMANKLIAQAEKMRDASSLDFGSSLFNASDARISSLQAV